MLSLARLGAGVPDLLVAYHGRSVLLECKTDKGVLNQKQQDFYETWRGEIATVRTPDQAIGVMVQNWKRS